MSNEQGYPQWYVDLHFPQGPDDLSKQEGPVVDLPDTFVPFIGTHGQALKPRLEGPPPPMPPSLLMDEEGREYSDDLTEEDVEKAELLDRALAKYDTSSLEEAPGKHDNWIEGVGGDLPSYVRAVAHALIRAGHPKSQAIGMAIGTMKRWASGGGDVTAKTRAKAAAAVAEWEALKAKAAAK